MIARFNELTLWVETIGCQSNSHRRSQENLTNFTPQQFRYNID
jgi:hypothetical protein